MINLGVPLASEKSVGPTTKLTYLGLENWFIETGKSLFRQIKISSIRQKITEALQSEKVSLKSSQSLIGSLSFICKAVSPGRAFLRRFNRFILRCKEFVVHDQVKQRGKKRFGNVAIILSSV